MILPDEVVLEEANPFYLQEALEVIAGSPRGGGQKEEEQTVAYISRMLTDYGYQVTLQKFQVREPSGETVLRTNVAAVRPGPSPEADMVLVGCCHGTAAGSPGAVHSASGVRTRSCGLSAFPTDPGPTRRSTGICPVSRRRNGSGLWGWSSLGPWDTARPWS